jgi:TRAP-type C4-dicarboxylate transport system permease small subunit
MSNVSAAAARRPNPVYWLHGVLTDLGYILAGTGLAAMGLLYCLEVVLRYFFNRPTSWSLETITFLLLIVTFLALPHAVRAGMHIAVTLLADLFPRHNKRILFFCNLAGVALCGFLAYLCLLANLAQIRGAIETSGNITIPKWWLSVFITYGFANSALWYVRLLLNSQDPIAPILSIVPAAISSTAQQ